MKKILLTLLLLILFIPGVNADTITKEIAYQTSYPLSSIENCSSYSNLYYYNDFETFISESSNKVIFNELYEKIIKYYNENYKETHPYYILSVELISTDYDKFTPYQILLKIKAVDDYNHLYDDWASPTYNLIYLDIRYYNNTYFDIHIGNNTACDISKPIISTHVSLFSNYYMPLLVFESNYNSLVLDTDTTYNITNKDGTISTYVGEQDYYPIYYPEGYNGDIYDKYIEVNLDNYEYVILNLKNYNRTDAFDTNLKVKGMIGITPVHEFGTVEKTEITDRCNISYEEYTDYRLYILKNDLTNNAIYYVKACEDNSSFKFDSSVFNITYITAETVNDPVITVGGVEYKTIPFNQLTNSANQNEENNFIPGESGSSLSDIITDSTKLTSNIWNAIQSFMGLVTKFFNTLPEEFRYLSITAFTILITISIIKFLKG